MEEMVGQINRFGNYVIDPDAMPEPWKQHPSLLIRIQRIARSLLLILAATAACTFFSACVGHQARVENRQEERRADRQERRQDRQEQRQDGSNQ